MHLLVLNTFVAHQRVALVLKIICVAYAQVQQQLVSHMRRLGLPLTSCSGDMEVLRKAIVQVGEL